MPLLYDTCMYVYNVREDQLSVQMEIGEKRDSTNQRFEDDDEGNDAKHVRDYAYK